MRARQENDGEGNYCSIDYFFKGELNRPALLSFHPKDRHEIVVSARPKVLGPRPVLAGPESTVVKTCGCFNSGRYCRPCVKWIMQTELSSVVPVSWQVAIVSIIVAIVISHSIPLVFPMSSPRRLESHLCGIFATAAPAG